MLANDLFVLRDQLAAVTAHITVAAIHHEDHDEIVSTVCWGLDRVAELPALLVLTSHDRVDADVMAQVDVVASAAGRLAEIIRASHENGSLGPHETSSSLALANEIASLADQCVLVAVRRALAAQDARRPIAATVACGADWVARAAGCAEFVHLWPVTVAAAVAGFAALVGALVRRRPSAHHVLDQQESRTRR